MPSPTLILELEKHKIPFIFVQDADKRANYGNNKEEESRKRQEVTSSKETNDKTPPKSTQTDEHTAK